MCPPLLVPSLMGGARGYAMGLLVLASTLVAQEIRVSRWR